MLLAALLLAAGTSTNCDAVKSMSTPQTIVMAAEAVPAGVFTPPPPPAPAAGVAPPAAAGRCARGARADSGALPREADAEADTRLEHLLRAMDWAGRQWNGKLLVVGNGGFAGSIQGYGDMQVALRLGYATAADRHGAQRGDGPNGMFALGHPEKIVDFAYRALPRHDGRGKRLIKAMYSRNVQMSYYKGCSTGGREGVMAAQRFPDDYDGIIAGALANRHIHMHTAGSARAIVLARNPDMAIAPEKSQDGLRGRDEPVRRAARGLPEQPARMHVRLHDAALQRRRLQ